MQLLEPLPTVNELINMSGLSKLELSRRTGIDVTLIYKYCSGMYEPRFYNYKLIYEAVRKELVNNMTLEEAILHCEEVADRCAITDGNIQCENDHRQLAKWLRELKVYKTSSSIVHYDGKVYISNEPKLKTQHKEGECCFAGFWEAKENERE